LWEEALNSSEKSDEKIVKDSKNLFTIKLEEEFVAKEPTVDVRRGGIVGVDFGTKSTIFFKIN